jgi:hypothetical protein
VVITGYYVIHVGRDFRAAKTSVGVPVCAAIVVAPQDALTNNSPVGWEALTPIRTSPLRHERITDSTWKGKAPTA